MSGKDRQDWETMLRADPALQAAWNGYLAQLERDAALVVQAFSRPATPRPRPHDRSSRRPASPSG